MTGLTQAIPTAQPSDASTHNDNVQDSVRGATIKVGKHGLLRIPRRTHPGLCRSGPVAVIGQYHGTVIETMKVDG